MECAGRALMFWSYQVTQEVYVRAAGLNSSLANVLQFLPGVPGKEPGRQILAAVQRGG